MESVMNVKEMGTEVARHAEILTAVQEELSSVQCELTTVRDELAALHKAIEDLREQLGDVTTRVEARNKSSAQKRNMTDDDAERCLTGDAKGFDHKEAAEMLGLTYAQVYSCRLEYTFKHVHKTLRDKGFKNEWAKK
jgi:predicted  nucleic acid-binding Zn-ribbon protein